MLSSTHKTQFHLVSFQQACNKLSIVPEVVVEVKVVVETVGVTVGGCWCGGGVW